MTYYRSYEYGEKYRISFKDVDENQWRICISKPNYSGNVTELTGAEFPVEWTGTGDEKQDKVMCGSTGYLRLICQSGQESIFTIGNLLPDKINDCRVQVKRYTYWNQEQGYIWMDYWQGFIKPDIYSQDWDSTPYEIELPIVSAVSALEFFPMPLPGDNMYDLFMQRTNIAGLLRMIAIAIGCDIRWIITNKPVYEDFNGDTTEWSGGGNVHWTQGIVSPAYYYDIDSGIMKPKTFKDVFENICYPYGKIHDYYLGFAIMMTWKNDVASGAKIHSLNVWENYANHTISSDVRFSEAGNACAVNLSQIDVAGTDNKYSLISRPSKVTFTKDIDTSKEIFELSDKFIKTTLPIGDSISGRTIERITFGGSSDSMSRWLYAIHHQYINDEFGQDWVYAAGLTQELSQYAFCRVVEASGDDPNNNNYSVPVPLAFCFNINTSSPNAVWVDFTLPIGIKTVNGVNELVLTLKHYRIDQRTPYEFNADDLSLFPYCMLQDLTTNKYLNYSNGAWSWEDTIYRITPIPLVHSGDDYILRFNENRDSNDNSLHKLRITLGAQSDTVLSGNTYGRLYTMMKLEYGKCKALTNQIAMAAMAESIQRNGNSYEYGGSGDELNISFKTQCGTRNLIVDGTVMLPKYSFCNAQTYIDGHNREKIEINAAKFQRYDVSNQLFDFAAYYVIVKDGTKVFVPVAVGMNPRMNTVSLKLISTNVT